MAKKMQLSIILNAAMSGSLMSDLARATSAMRGLKNAASGRASFGLNLQSKLSELKQAQQAMERLKALRDGGLRESFARYQNAAADRQRLQSELASSRQANAELKTRIGELQRLRDQIKGVAREQVSDEIKRLQGQYKARQSALDQLSRQLRDAGRSERSAQNDWKRQAAELRQLASSLNAAGMSSEAFAAAQNKLKSALDAVNAGLRGQERLNAAYRAQTEAGQTLDEAWGGMQNALGTAQTILQPFKAAVSNAETFEHAMSRVKSLTQSKNIREGRMDLVESEMRELEAQARELGATTQFTMTEAAQAQGFLGMAGWNKNQIVKAMPGMLDLAAASGMDLARTADIVSDNLTALGMNADQVGHMTDVYAYALTRSNLNMEALGESMKYAAPAMHAYGGDIHDAAAAMMIMGNAGIKGSMAGTALRMGLLRLAGPPKKASKELDALGISLSDATRMAYESQAQLEALGIRVAEDMAPTEKMQYVLQELGQKMQGLSQDEKLAAVGAIFGVNAASGWLAVLEQGPQVFGEFRNALREADGTAKQVARTMNDDTRGAWLYLESALDAVSNNVGSAFLPALKSTYEALNPIVTSTAQWIGEHPRVVQGFGAIAAAASAGVVALGAFRLAMAGIGFVTTTLELMRASAAMSTLTATLGGAAGFAAKLGAVFTIIRTQGLATGIKAVGYALRGALAALGPFGLALAAVSLAIANWDSLAPVIERIGSALKQTFPGLAAAFGGIFDDVLSKLGLIEKKMSVLKEPAAVKSDLDRTVEESVRLSGSETDALTLNTREKLRGLKEADDETIARELVDASRSVKQTDAAQSQIKEMWAAELSRYKGELSEERRANILRLANDEQYSIKTSGVEELTRALTEQASRVDLQEASARAEYLSMAKETLQREGNLSSREQAAVLSRLSETVEALAGEKSFGEALEKTLTGISTKSVKEQDAAVERMLQASRESDVDLSTQLKEMSAWINRQEVSDAAKESMQTSLMEGLQARTDAAIGKTVEAMTRESADQHALVERLATYLSSFKDQSEEARRERASTVEKKLGESGYQGEELKSVLQELSVALKSKSEERAEREASAIKKYEGRSESETLWSGLKKMFSGSESQMSLSTLSTALDAQRLGLQLPQAPAVQAPQMQKLEVDVSELSASISTAIKESRDESSLVEALTSVLSAREDQTAAAQEQMLSTVQTMLESTGEYTNEQIESIMSSVGENLSSISEEARSSFSDAASSLNESTSMMGASLTEAGAQAQQTGAAMGELAAATQLPNAGLAQLGGSSSEAAGAVSGLGSAASSAISSLMSAAASVGSAISGAVSSAAASAASFIGIKSNALGGIYPRGEFVTTFAEDSAEAAIPIVKTQRSINIWRRVGQMLGLLPKSPSVQVPAGDMPSEKPESESTGSQKKKSWLQEVFEKVKDAIPHAEYEPPKYEADGDLVESVKRSRSYEAMQARIKEIQSQKRRSAIEIIKARAGSIPLPQMPIPDLTKTTPTFPTIPIESKSSLADRATDSLSTKLFEAERLQTETRQQSSNASMPALNLSFTFNGNVDREEVKRGVRESLPMMLSSFEEQMRRYEHEKERWSF